MQNIEATQTPVEVVKLDLKDKKILFELDFDARMPFSKLSKKVGLSKRSVEYRVKRLAEAGVIKKFCTVTNAHKFYHHHSCNTLIAFKNAGKVDREKIFKYLFNHRKGLWVSKGEGSYDILITTYTKTLIEFKKFIEEFNSKFKDKIKIVSHYIIADNIQFQARFLLGVEDGKMFHTRESFQNVKIDNLDRKILIAIRNDARKPLIKISKQVSQSSKVVAYRIKKMERNNIIECYRTYLDYNKMGYLWYKIFININKISLRRLEKLKRYIGSKPIVKAIIEEFGSLADLNVEVVVSSEKQLLDFIHEMKIKFPGVIEDYKTVVSYGNARWYTGPL